MALFIPRATQSASQQMKKKQTNPQTDKTFTFDKKVKWKWKELTLTIFARCFLTIIYYILYTIKLYALGLRGSPSLWLNVLSTSTKLILRCKLLSDSLNCQEPDDTYQCGFQQDEGYDMRLKRDDRRHQKGRGLDIHGEVKTNKKIIFI